MKDEAKELTQDLLNEMIDGTLTSRVSDTELSDAIAAMEADRDHNYGETFHQLCLDLRDARAVIAKLVAPPPARADAAQGEDEAWIDEVVERAVSPYPYGGSEPSIRFETANHVTATCVRTFRGDDESTSFVANLVRAWLRDHLLAALARRPTSTPAAANGGEVEVFNRCLAAIQTQRQRHGNEQWFDGRDWCERRITKLRDIALARHAPPASGDHPTLEHRYKYARTYVLNDAAKRTIDERVEALQRENERLKLERAAWTTADGLLAWEADELWTNHFGRIVKCEWVRGVDSGTWAEPQLEDERGGRVYIECCYSSREACEAAAAALRTEVKP